MKNKLLLATIAATISVASFANAAVTTSGAPSLQISGKLMAYGIGASQNEKTRAVDIGNFGTKGDIRFNVEGVSEGGFKYGGLLILDVRRQKAAGKDFVKNAYVYASHDDIGYVQLGELDGALKQTMVSGANLMGGTGGFDGDMWTVTNLTAGLPGYFDPISYDQYATKVVLKTPVLGGLQLVFSYTPHSKLYGTLAKTNSGGLKDELVAGKTPGAKRQTELAASYGFGLGDVAVNLYAGGAVATPVLPTGAAYQLNTVKTYQLGFLVDYASFQFAGGYIDNQKSMLRKYEVGNTGKQYNLAVSYTTGPNSVAVGYQGARRSVKGGLAKANVGSLTYERKIAPGLTLFGEANYFQTKTTADYLAGNGTGGDVSKAADGFIFASNTKKNNSGQVYLMGATLRF